MGYAATNPTQYVAIKAEDGVTRPSGYYTQAVDGADYYVKEGYHIVVEYDKPYYDGEEGFPATGNVIHVYRNTEEYANSHPGAGGAWEESDKNGLISSVQVMNADLRDEKGQPPHNGQRRSFAGNFSGYVRRGLSGRRYSCV